MYRVSLFHNFATRADLSTHYPDVAPRGTLAFYGEPRLSSMQLGCLS
jgi:hypothetical protein